MSVSDTMSRREVLIIQRAIPHYRVPVFKRLSQSQVNSYTLAVGRHDERTATGIPAQEISGLHVVAAPVFKLPFGLLVQRIRSLKSFEVVIIDISINLLSAPLYIFYARFMGTKVIGWGKGVPQKLIKKESTWKRAYKKLLARNCDALLLYGNVSKVYFRGLGVTTPMFIAQNTIDTESLINDATEDEKKARLLRTYWNVEDRIVFGYFGQLTTRKKVDHIIRAFKLVFTQLPNAYLIIAGGGPVSDDLAKLVKKEQLNASVRMLGRIPPGQEGEMLRSFDVYLSYEQGGLGILEAMATGRAIVSNSEEFPETELLEDHYNAILATEHSVEAFAEAMLQMGRNSELRQTIGKNALETLKNKATLANMIAAFEEAIDSFN
jgi:glycosyltransferase involved in cell wall biosynthesis